LEVNLKPKLKNSKQSQHSQQAERTMLAKNTQHISALYYFTPKKYLGKRFFIYLSNF